MQLKVYFLHLCRISVSTSTVTELQQGFISCLAQDPIKLQFTSECLRDLYDAGGLSTKKHSSSDSVGEDADSLCMWSPAGTSVKPYMCDWTN